MVTAVPLGLALGVALGALGGGGAVLAVPLLVYVLGQDVHAATTTSLAVVAGAGVAAGAVHAGRAQVCWSHVAVLAPAAVAAAAAGSAANKAATGTAVLVTFVPVLLGAAALMWRRAGREPDERRAGAKSEAGCPPLDTPRALLAGLVLGALTGFFGVGGGFLVVPLLVLTMRFPLGRAIGTSLVIVAVVSLAALVVHLAGSVELDVAVTVGMAGGCVAGALAGAQLGQRLPTRTLGRAFAAVVALAGIYILGATAAGGPPGT